MFLKLKSWFDKSGVFDGLILGFFASISLIALLSFTPYQFHTNYVLALNLALINLGLGLFVHKFREVPTKFIWLRGKPALLGFIYSFTVNIAILIFLLVLSRKNIIAGYGLDSNVNNLFLLGTFIIKGIAICIGLGLICGLSSFSSDRFLRKIKRSELVYISIVCLILGYILNTTRFRLHYADSWGIRLIPVVYGFPSQELIKEAEAGQVELGGCIISPIGPDRVIEIRFPRSKEAS
ncbi:hypothetical protein BVX98_05525 [bacterium F11]|nr:hypothetical protein BVX98_05525 [bacterium F11]